MLMAALSVTIYLGFTAKNVIQISRKRNNFIFSQKCQKGILASNLRTEITTTFRGYVYKYICTSKLVLLPVKPVTSAAGTACNINFQFYF
jgi:hypothetical protein